MALLSIFAVLTVLMISASASPIPTLQQARFQHNNILPIVVVVTSCRTTVMLLFPRHLEQLVLLEEQLPLLAPLIVQHLLFQVIQFAKVFLILTIHIQVAAVAKF